MWPGPDPGLPFLETSHVSSKNSLHIILQVIGSYLRFVAWSWTWSAIQYHQKDSSDGTVNNQYLRDEEEDWERQIRGCVVQ